MKLVEGVGINDADYIVRKAVTVSKGKQKTVWKCPYYVTWGNMLKRCYSTTSPYVNYEGCSVCEEWLRFSNFKSWMEQQDWEGKELDKDLLFKGNRVYSPETCVFIKSKINTFINESVTRGNGLLQGVSYDSSRSKFRAQINDPFLLQNTFLGRYDTEIEAHIAWGVSKLRFAVMLAELEDLDKVKRALVMRYISFKDFLYDPEGSNAWFLECLNKWEDK